MRLCSSGLAIRFPFGKPPDEHLLGSRASDASLFLRDMRLASCSLGPCRVKWIFIKPTATSRHIRYHQARTGVYFGASRGERLIGALGAARWNISNSAIQNRSRFKIFRRPLPRLRTGRPLCSEPRR